MDEASLIARVVLHDDHHAFNQLVRLHQSSVRLFLRRLTCGDEAFADDLAQETFLAAYQHIGSFRNRSSLRSWLCGIAVNLFRSEKRHKRWQVESVGVPAGGEGERPAGQDRGVLQKQVLAALAGLGEDQRVALCLHTAAGLSHEETARIMEIPLGTVKTHVLRGKQRLREILGVEG